ncbi:DUF1249 domain-containing protein [Alkalisalibacterium limincola]|uniref:DUF1249 domain-containing protein n=1 Tax=Alkalisalibacterium limincola TaxID=2699169 RepID=A0A5C8KVI7_9GAMM|nr:DUF1249 domain-containing protein [Alkalisalibacterium limincola]TXK64502.1 DUF1249 domain-containing protein [Alkalisalibacterium limincola]
MLATRATAVIPRFSRFAWLMGLYAENHQRLQRIFAPADLAPGEYVSSIGDGLDLHLSVIARHAYTVELKLTYGLLDPETGEADPSAHVRMYNDALQVEATHCYAGRRWQDVLGLRPAHSTLLNHRLRMNAFLNKWLAYIDEQGHGRHSLRSRNGLGSQEKNSLGIA